MQNMIVAVIPKKYACVAKEFQIVAINSNSNDSRKSQNMTNIAYGVRKGVLDT